GAGCLAHSARFRDLEVPDSRVVNSLEGLHLAEFGTRYLVVLECEIEGATQRCPHAVRRSAASSLGVFPFFLCGVGGQFPVPLFPSGLGSDSRRGFGDIVAPISEMIGAQLVGFLIPKSRSYKRCCQAFRV